jgi:hypothetical protein
VHSAFRRRARGSTQWTAAQSAVLLPVIGAFQRHSSQLPLPCWPPSSANLLLKPFPSGCVRSCVQRTGCGAFGLGYPHQVWWDPPPDVHNTCLGPVGSTGFLINASTCIAPWAVVQVLPHAVLRGRFRAVWSARAFFVSFLCSCFPRLQPWLMAAARRGPFAPVGCRPILSPPLLLLLPPPAALAAVRRGPSRPWGPSPCFSLLHFSFFLFLSYTPLSSFFFRPSSYGKRPTSPG